MPYKSLLFQQKAVESLKRVILEQWTRPDSNHTIVFKSSTGSGKTVMMAELVKSLVYDKEWQEDVAFVWISFSPESAMQSRDKFEQYYAGNTEIKLLDLEILKQKEIGQNEVLFVNWQILKATNADGRKARNDRPEQYKISFDNLLANTHRTGRSVVLLIDEAHIQTGAHLALTTELLDIISPKITIHITATPDATVELEARQNDTFVQVKREEVVAAQLIKESLIIMPEEEIQKIQESRKKTEQNIDLDELLLELAIEKKKDLEAAYKKLGKTINPLVLIQLPNKDKESEDRNEETKEHFVRRFLAEQGVESYRVATWLSGHQENLVEITNNHSHIDYLLFKEAPATGWDCPRASILVMYRDIKKDSFRTQIIGRILRMPEAQHYSDPQLNAGYIYTNYQRAEIKDIPDTAKNQVKTQFSTIRPYLQNITLSSVFFNRASYNDLGADFQAVFISVANEFFGLSGDLTESIHQNAREKLIKKGLDFELFEKLQIAMIVNAKISDFDYFNRELKTKGEQKNYELSGNDLQRLFDLLCYRAIGDQQEESRKYNVSRSWEPLKRAIRVWLGYTVPSDQKIWYKIVCNDLLKEDSVLKRIIGDALEKYRLVHAKKVEGKKSKDKTEFEWTVPTSRAFGQDFQEMMPQPRLSALNPFFVQSEYRGKQNEEKFIEFLEEQGDKIEWWYKNGDQGREHFAVSYTDSQTASEEAFYVDWIIKFKTGDLIGLYDTKGGITAKEGEVKDKAEWLQKYIAKFNDASQKLMGGIVIDSAGWKVQNNKQYQYNLLNLGQAGWKNLEL